MGYGFDVALFGSFSGFVDGISPHTSGCERLLFDGASDVCIRKGHLTIARSSPPADVFDLAYNLSTVFSPS